MKPHNWLSLVARETGSVLRRNTLWDWLGEATASLIRYYEVAQDSESGSKLVGSQKSSKVDLWCNSTTHRPSLPATSQWPIRLSCCDRIFMAQTKVWISCYSTASLIRAPFQYDRSLPFEILSGPFTILAPLINRVSVDPE